MTRAWVVQTAHAPHSHGHLQILTDLEPVENFEVLRALDPQLQHLLELAGSSTQAQLASGVIMRTSKNTVANTRLERRKRPPVFVKPHSLYLSAAWRRAKSLAKLSPRPLRALTKLPENPLTKLPGISSRVLRLQARSKDLPPVSEGGLGFSFSVGFGAFGD